MPAHGEYFACVQLAEGEPERPYVVPVKLIRASEIEFTVRMPTVDQDGKPAPDTVIEFRGVVGREGLKLSSPEKALLRRDRSYWQ